MMPMENAMMLGDNRTVAFKTDMFPEIIFMYSESENQAINASNVVALWQDLFPEEEVRLPSPKELLNEYFYKLEMRTLQFERDGKKVTYVVFEAANGKVFIVDPENPSPNFSITF